MHNNLDDECPICLDINGHNECVMLDCCNKYIHKDCINTWLLQNIKNNNILNNNCFYCYKNNKYIDDFINKNKNHHIVNINGQIDNQILESNNNTIVIISENYLCIRIFIVLFLFFVIIVPIATILGTTLN